MATYSLTDRQKNLLRSLVPGLKAESIDTQWGIGRTMSGITIVPPLPPEIREQLMPFAQEFRLIYDNHISPIGQSLNLTIRRADDFFSRHEILDEIWSAIYNSR